jgi:hypothetical protein
MEYVRRKIDNVKVRGWIVYSRTNDEILAMKRTLLNN